MRRQRDSAAAIPSTRMFGHPAVPPAPAPRPMVAGDAFCSFAGDTPVATADGDVPISEIESGDQVLAYNETTGATDTYTVTATWAHADPVVTTITLDGEEIETTPEHPFYVLLKDWVPAGQLQAGDAVRRADGSSGVVEDVTHAQRPQVMYNFTVAKAHTYFVGDGQWLVHNACPPGGYKRWDTDRHRELKVTDVYPTGNRAPGYSPSPVDNQIQSHHIIQNEWAFAQHRAGRPGFAHYDQNDAIAILLESARGHEHAIITGRQATARNQRVQHGVGRWDSSYAEELTSAYTNLRAAGIPHPVAWDAVKQAHQYFVNLGVPTTMYRP